MHRCRIHCPGAGGGAGFVLGVIVAAWLLLQVVTVAVLLAVLGAAVAVAGLAYVSRLLAWRLSVAPFLERRADYPVRVRADMRAVGRASLRVEAPAHAAIEAPRVVPGVVVVEDEVHAALRAMGKL